MKVEYFPMGVAKPHDLTPKHWKCVLFVYFYFSEDEKYNARGAHRVKRRFECSLHEAEEQTRRST